MATKVLFRTVFAIALLGMSVLASAAGFSFQDTQGKTHTLAGYKGKWVLVNFWATWCPPCLEEIPDLIALHDKHKDKDLVVLGVALDYRSPQQVKEFADQMFITYPVILGTYESAAQVGAVNGLPTTYLFNPQGKIVAYNVGALTRKAIENYIKAKK
ncbi:MAG: TlpA disulfide reductase family protein [Sulfuricella sp.]